MTELTVMCVGDRIQDANGKTGTIARILGWDYFDVRWDDGTYQSGMMFGIDVVYCA